MFSRFGPPRTVYTVRGQEIWQDDVVFVYSAGDFYIYRDRVWQISVQSVFGMKVGDAKAVALLVLGENAQDRGSYLLCDIGGFSWPMSLRINFDAEKISAIYIFRPDF